jgi:hypothetical protein
MLSLKDLGQMIVKDAEIREYAEWVFANTKKPETSESLFCREMAVASLAAMEKCTEDLVKMARPENELVH